MTPEMLEKEPGQVEQISKPLPPVIGLPEFLSAVLPCEGHYAIFLRESKAHYWADSLGALAALVTQYSDRTDGYFATAAFSKPVSRTSANVASLKAFRLDIDAGKDKLKRHGPDAVYADPRAAMEDLRRFGRQTGLYPNFVLFSGEGLHVYYTLDKAIRPDEWTPRAKQLQDFCLTNGLKIDTSVTTDLARVLRAPGTTHRNGKRVRIICSKMLMGRTVEDFSAAIGYAERKHAQMPLPSVVKLTGHNPYSYQQAAQKCAAMQLATQHHGQGVPYPVWILAVRSAALSTEGRKFAHDISSGHADYSEADTDKKLDSLSGGPANKAAWGNAYGPKGPCEACELATHCKNPAVQFGTVVSVNPLCGVAALQPTEAVDWVDKLNERFALVRVGPKIEIADYQTPVMTGRGVDRGFGFLETPAFHQMMRGRLAPPDSPENKARPLAAAWLEHPGRRQYEGLVFAPGEHLPPEILNLWRGFAVAPVVGDVSLWLAVLAALVPNESDRTYVLRWLAWKIQNPGGVPDTLLIFKGIKGAGKNSLFDPLVLLFGRHAMVADDAELIAGRFTWHLMSMAFAVLDEAVFGGDPRQMDRIKSRVTAKTMLYEQKGKDPVSGVNRCGFVMLTNHEYVWQATSDERRAVVVEVGDDLRGKLEFWRSYHAWAVGTGPAALLHYLQGVDLASFNPRQIPKSEALRQQVEQTALRTPAVAWWHQCLSEGVIRWTENGVGYTTRLNETEDTKVKREALRMSYEQSAAGRARQGNDWSSVAKKLKEWALSAGGMRTARTGGAPLERVRVDVLPPLPALQTAFTAATQVCFDD